MKLRAVGSGALPMVLIDWLLEGRPRVNDDADPARAPGVYDTLVTFDEPGPDLEALWRRHRAWLLAEAQRRGIARPWGCRFDGDEAA